MAYSFSQGSNVYNLTELQYGTGTEIRFSPFTSCIGVIARQGNYVTGFHLAIYSGDDKFDNAAATNLMKLLEDYDEIVVAGQTAVWTESVGSAYYHLLSLMTKPKIFAASSGFYGARINGNKLQLVHGAYVDIDLLIVDEEENEIN